MPGDRFLYVNGSIFCEHDHPGPEVLGGHAAAPLQAGGRMSEQKVRRRQRRSGVEVLDPHLLSVRRCAETPPPTRCCARTPPCSVQPGPTFPPPLSCSRRYAGGL